MVKLLVLPGMIHGCSAIPIKNSSQLFYHMERQKTQNSQHSIEGEQSPGLTLPDLKTCDRVSVALVTELTNRGVRQNRVRRNRPTEVQSLIFDKGAKTLSSTRGAGTAARAHAENGSRPYGLHDNALNMHHRPQRKMQS